LISNYTLVTKVVELIFMNITELVLPFLDFSTIAYEFSKLAEKEMEKKVTDSLQTGPWKVLKQSNRVPGRLSSRGQIDGDQFRRDSSLAARGKGGENAQGLTRDSGVTGVGPGRSCSGGATEDRDGGGGWKLGGDVPVARGSGKGRRVPGELREVDVVLLVCLAGAGKHWWSRTTTRPSCGGGETTACSWAGVSGGGNGKWPAR
jgi:hypothetical protein